MNDVTLSIVSYCQKDLLDRCLAGIGSLNLPASWRTILVDNNSSDGSADMVAQRYSWVELVRLRNNLGFAAGNNIAFARSQNPIFLVLNPDIMVMPGGLEILVRTLEEFPKAAIVGPQLLNQDGSLQYSARRFYDWKTVLTRRLPIPGSARINELHLMKDLNQNTVQCVDWILGAAMAIRRSAFIRPDLFDVRYRMYFEDVDLCYFARKRGWDVLYCPQSKMIHDHQRSSARLLPNASMIKHFQSWIRFRRKIRMFDRMNTNESGTEINSMPDQCDGATEVSSEYRDG